MPLIKNTDFSPSISPFSLFRAHTLSLAAEHSFSIACVDWGEAAVHRLVFNPSVPKWLIEPRKVVLTFESFDEILRCDRSNETSSAVLSRGTIYLVCCSNFWVSGSNPMVLPLNWNLFSNTFTWYYLFSMLLLLLSLWIRSYGVTIQMKPLQQYFHVVVFI